MRDRLNITAHSGSDGFPANSLAAINAGIRLGADFVEVDVRFDGDGVLVLSHDPVSGAGYRSCHALFEAFDIIRNTHAGINCDIKDPAVIPSVLELARQAGIGRDRLVLTGSITPALALKNPDIQKQAMIWINAEEALRYMFQTNSAGTGKLWDQTEGGLETRELYKVFARNALPLAKVLVTHYAAWGIEVINMYYQESIAACIPFMREQGLKASVWTVSDREPLKALFNAGAYSVTTRDTGLAVKLRRQVS